MIRRIQTALREGKPAQVLALGEQHRQRWPNGRFRQEREGARVLAACKLQLPNARKRALAFVSKHRRGALTPRVRAACGLPP
ncbi:MAG: hypothetical protein OXU20_34460 [Myxococcales bacterium]|nr:hypothetical protein [Myxococcales bacterium]MDD9969324.1 hypothetical protein [Myxococcales bacterium]